MVTMMIGIIGIVIHTIMDTIGTIIIHITAATMVDMGMADITIITDRTTIIETNSRSVEESSVQTVAGTTEIQ